VRLKKTITAIAGRSERTRPKKVDKMTDLDSRRK
jgi:hypothetical protein